VLVDVEVGARVRGLAGEHDERGAALGGLGDAGDRVGQAGALVDGEDRHLAGHPGVGAGHGGRAALVAGRDEAHALAHQGVGDVEVAAADHAERGPDARRGEHPADDLGDDHFGCPRSTRASTRTGLPEPPTMGSGGATTSAPVAGSRSRLRSMVSPYLPAPCMKAWQGKAGSKEWAAPASVPTVSTPSPMTGASSASQRAHSTEMPGVCGPFSSALRKVSWAPARASQPVR